MSAKYERLAVIIAKAREARGWTQADLAQLTYMSDTAIANVEAGRPPNLVALSAVEQALGWLPGMFDFVLRQQGVAEDEDEASGEAEGAGSGEGDGDGSGEVREWVVARDDDEDGFTFGLGDGDGSEDEDGQVRELVADSTVDWA
jgi:transcriptional regulator with XRE-family HTH domain